MQVSAITLTRFLKVLLLMRHATRNGGILTGHGNLFTLKNILCFCPCMVVLTLLESDAGQFIQ